MVQLGHLNPLFRMVAPELYWFSTNLRQTELDKYLAKVTRIRLYFHQIYATLN